MKRSVSIVFLIAALLATSFVKSQERPAPRPPADEKPLVVEPARPKPAVQPQAVGRRDLSIREARKLGITLFSVRGHVKELRADGIIDDTTSNAEISALVLDRISAGDVDSFREGVDLDSLLAFIESLIELIMKLFVF